MDDVEFFQRKLYKAMHVPVSRLEADSGFSLGRESEISRDELLFSKFIQKLQTRFSIMFNDMMERQLILKGVLTANDWSKIKDKVHYAYNTDHYYTELKMHEIMTQRMTIGRDMEDMVGKYYSKEWFRANILHQSEKEIEHEDKQMEIEAEAEGGEEGEEEGGYGEEKAIDLGNDSSTQLTELSPFRKRNIG